MTRRAMPLYLVGAGGHARVVEDALRRSGISVAGLVDPFTTETSFRGAPIFREYPRSGAFFVTVGQVRTTDIRVRLWTEAVAAGLVLADAFCEVGAMTSASDVTYGAGTVVLAGAFIGIGTRVGVNCIVNHHAVIEHDCVIADHVHVSPGAVLGGGVRIGRSSHIGLGAIVRQGITIGENVTVGAGAVVVRDIDPDTTVVGVPARATGTD